MRPYTASSSPVRLASTYRNSLAATVGVVVFAIALGVSLAPAARAVTLSDKQAQAAALDQQVSGLEQQYAQLQERYRGAKIDLTRTQKKEQRTKGKLERSRTELRRAKSRLEDRALAVYRDGAGSSELLEVARAGSFSEFFDKLDTIQRVGTNDAKLLDKVRDLTNKVERQERSIRAARVRKAKLVRKINTSRKRMGKVLGDRQAALDSVTSEVRTLMEQQRAAEAAQLVKDSRARAKAIGDGKDPNTVVPPDSSDTGSAATAHTDASATDEPGTSAAQPAVSVPLPPASGAASAAAGIAMGKIGAPYVYGASGPDSFDCSGLIVWAFAQAGRSGLPHSTYSLMGMGVSVPLSQAQVGDIVITDGGGHAGIYVGGGSMVHAPRTGRTVAVESLGNFSVVDVRRI